MSERSWSFIACLRMDIFIKERQELVFKYLKNIQTKRTIVWGSQEIASEMIGRKRII